VGFVHPDWVRRQVVAWVSQGWTATAAARRFDIDPGVVVGWVNLAGMHLRSGRHGGLASPVPAVPDVVSADFPGARTCHGRLTSTGRALIQFGLAMRWSMRAIAAEIGVAPSTVSREIARARVAAGSGRYDAQRAQKRADAERDRRRRRRPRSLDRPELRAVVVALLNQRCSPQQIAGRLPVLFPDRDDMRVSHETIYQALYVQGRGSLRQELTVVKALRSGRTQRRPMSKLPRRTSRPWLEGARLTDRPAEVNDRAIPGHWEGDLVVGPDSTDNDALSGSGLVTLVERNTRFTLIGRLPGVRDSETVIQVLTRLGRTLPAELVKTITWDQGQEMAQHAKFTIATGCQVFFCDPHSPWQRGTNENTNGLIRDFYPKGTDFNLATDEDLAETTRLLNNRPRRTLQFHTPAEKMAELLTGVALTA
jgi:IS30 family transposase